MRTARPSRVVLHCGLQDEPAPDETPAPHPTGFSQAATLQMEWLADGLCSTYQTHRAARPDSPQQRKSILIVEDQDDIRRLIRMAVQMEGHSVHEADSGDLGLAMALELKPDLVVLDVVMPGALHGLQVCRAIKSHPTPPCVVLLTGLRGRDDIQAGHAAGADAYLLKPFSPGQLMQTIHQQLGLV
jgi:two-component system phosphate regulon response regulator PhoB